MKMVLKYVLLVLNIAAISAQCPWPNSIAALNSACKCKSSSGDFGTLEISCNRVNFALFIKTLKNISLIFNKSLKSVRVTNTTVGILPNGIFKGIKTTSLILDKCQIRIVGDDAFEDMGSTLQVLNLMNNYITLIPTKALRKLPLLKSLDLSRNKIGLIEDEALSYAKNLENLELAENQILLSNTAFSGLESSLKMLNLKGAGQEEVPTAVLNLTSLKLLDLAQNKIQQIKSKQFQNIYNLEWLNLERNRIMELHGDAFEGIGTTLRTLSLLNNILLRFPKEALSKLVNLRTLDIGFNGIPSIPNDAFANVKYLSLVAIEGNPLSTIPHEAFKHLKNSLLGLSFGGRYLKCDCRMKWVAEWMEETSIQVTSRERNPQYCGTPDALQELSFQKIEPKMLVCDEPITTTTTTTTTTPVPTTKTPKTTTEEITTTTTEEITTTRKIIYTQEETEDSSVVEFPPEIKVAGPPFILPPPPIMKVNNPPKKPLQPNRNRPGKSPLHEIDITKVERMGKKIVVEWEALANNPLGYHVIYKSFGATNFKRSNQLTAQSRDHVISNLPEDECCYLVCVVAAEDVDMSVDRIPQQQCVKMESEEKASKLNIDNVIIGVSAGICILIIVAVVIFCICSCSKRSKNEKHYAAHPEPVKIEPDWDKTSLYSARSIPRARLYHDIKSNGSMHNDYLADDGRSYSFSHIPNGYSRSVMPDGYSQHSMSRNSYIPHIHEQSLGRQSAHSINHISTRNSQMGTTPPVEQRRKRLDRVGRVGGISAASSLHSLTSYEQDPATRHNNWNDHDMEIYVGRNHVARPNSKIKANYR